MVNGIVTDNGYGSALGYYIIIKDNKTNYEFLFAHMREQTPLQIGNEVQIGQYVGFEGTTGNSTGIHLHLQILDENYNTINPADFMGIPNEQWISVIYNGIPITPDPKPNNIKKSNFKWVIYTNKIRNKRKGVLR